MKLSQHKFQGLMGKFQCFLSIITKNSLSLISEIKPCEKSLNSMKGSFICYFGGFLSHGLNIIITNILSIQFII